jgi:hypothetical protein
VTFPVYDELAEHLKKKGDQVAVDLLEELARQAPLRPNPNGIPSMWYMALIDGHYFFDGFGFKNYMDEFGWKPGALDAHEKEFPPQRPLLPYLEKTNRRLAKRYDLGRDQDVDNDEWLIFDVDAID